MKYIFFDLDGTLTDPFLGITNSVIYALEKMGFPHGDNEEYRKFIGPPLRESFRVYCGMTEEQSEQAINTYREYFSPTGIFENRVYDGIPQTLEKLKSDGYILVLATSKPTVYAKRILQKFDLEKYFSSVYGSELDGTREKKDEVIACALDGISASPNDVLMVGDRIHDVIGAKANGVATVGVLYGYGGYDELKEAGAAAFASDPEDLYKKIISF